jgi:nucleotide-binding universal stress UspA family protein
MTAQPSRRAKGYLGEQNRKFLIVVDDTAECRRALRYASRRALHTGGGLTLLRIVSPADFQHWLGVEQVMREEAQSEARRILEGFAAEVEEMTGKTPELVIREGQAAQEIIRLIEEDGDIALLVLGAGTEAEGPGPLVSLFAGTGAGTFPIPITIVPGDLSDEEIEALA